VFSFFQLVFFSREGGPHHEDEVEGAQASAGLCGEVKMSCVSAGRGKSILRLQAIENGLD